MRISDSVDADRFPSVAKFLEKQVEVQIAELRVLLQQPLLQGGTDCSFAAANALLNLISGLSVCLFESSCEALTNRRDRGKRFKKLLREYFPWAGEQWSPDECSR